MVSSTAVKQPFPELTGRRACRRLGFICDGVMPVVFTGRVLDDILARSDQHAEVEVGGFLLGHQCEDEVADRPFIQIDEYVPAEQTHRQLHSLTFTHESWAALHDQLSSRFPDHQVVGWHHTHPGFGIFLSRQDEFIHRNFFDQPWQVAMVVDPARGELGLFQWKGKQIVNSGFLVSQAKRQA